MWELTESVRHVHHSNVKHSSTFFTGMKVYLHLEGEVSFTLAQNVSETTSVDDLLNEFVIAFNASSQGLRLAANGGTIKDVDGRTIRDNRKKLYTQLSAGDDLFLFVAIDDTCADASVAGNVEDNIVEDVDQMTLEDNISPTKSSKAKAKAKAKARAKAKANAKPGSITTEQKAELSKLVTAKSYKRAREIAESVLQEVNNADEYALRALGDIFYHTKSYTKAIEICKVALQTLPISLQIHYNLARSLMATKNFGEATDIVTAALRIQAKSISLVDEPASMRTEGFRMELIALHAECLFAQGQHNEAVALINDVTANPASAVSVPILIAYSSFAMQYNKFEEPTRALLKAVIMGEHPRVRELIARLMSIEAGMNEILKQVPPSAKPSDADSKGKAEVYAFLGYVGKCHSVVRASLRFYHLALQMQSANASYALNLVHVYEIGADYEGAMQVAQDFFKANPQLGVGVSAVRAKGAAPPTVLRCRDMLALLECDPTQSYSRESAQPAFSWVALEDNYGYMQFHSRLAEPGSESGEDGSPCSSSTPVKVRYSDPELDLLALFSTVVKVLFLQGKLHLLPGLYRVIEPCRMQSEKGLHETNIRNEMAYLQEIAQLLCYRSANASYGLAELGASAVSRAGLYNVAPLLDIGRSGSKSPPKPVSSTISPPSSSSSRSVPSSSSASEIPSLLRDAARRPIYVLGDSHSVSPAWSVVRIRGEPRLLVPRLATGVKHWHLRSDSTFYPRAHFHNMVASIPPGSDVILNVGEIDCREGILLSVERDYYSGFDEAVKHTLGVFLPVLKDLVSRHKLRVFVHPIPPVLDVTRAMVIRYNAFYKNAIAGIKGVHWLDFFDDLIESRQTGDSSNPVEAKLKPEFALDGTHLNPSYLRLLESNLTKQVKAGK